MMKIEQQHLSAIGTGQQRPHLRNQGSDTASPFCADKSENLGAVAVFLFPAAPPDPRHRIEELFRIKRLEQIFAAATAHSLDNKIRLRLRRHGKDRSIWSVGVNPFRHHGCAAAVAIEVQKADVGRRISNPFQHGFVIVQSIVAQMLLQPNNRCGIGKEFQDPPGVLIQTDTDQRQRLTRRNTLPR